MSETASRAGWTRVAFGDVVRLSRERSSHPEDDGFERYVGLDHLEPGDLKIRRWGVVGDGTTFTSVFHSGQVLFGKRRAYQRKVAVADFDGVCSGDIYVLEPSSPALLPDLLPLICQTDGFFEHAVGTSAGSLSPRTNWKSLADYEFDLPPIEEQRRIANALGGTASLAERYQEATGTLRLLLKGFLLAEYEAACQRAPMRRIADAGELRMGRQKAPKYNRGVNPRLFLRVANVGELELNLDSLERMDFSDQELARYSLRPGDVLLTEGDLMSELNVGRPALFCGEVSDCCFQNTLIRFRSGDCLRPEYSLLLFEAARLSRVFARAAKTTTVTHLGLGRLSDVRIPVPRVEHQDDVARILMAMLEARSALRERIRGCAALRSRLFEEALS